MKKLVIVLAMVMVLGSSSVFAKNQSIVNRINKTALIRVFDRTMDMFENVSSGFFGILRSMGIDIKVQEKFDGPLLDL